MQAEGQDVRCVILLNRNPGIALAVRDDLSAPSGKRKTSRPQDPASPGRALDGFPAALSPGARRREAEDVSNHRVGSSAAAVAALETNRSMP